MTTSRSQLPVLNLKERIAAIEQRNTENTASIQRATSPTPSVTSSSSHSGPSSGALRDKIARFEKKGGVPVPRGRFGFGAPPSVDGPRKRGELYGNRIPLPNRVVSGGNFPTSRPLSTSYTQRRSFSTSSLISDFDDQLNYTPISSATFTLPPDSPDSITSQSSTPDISPSLGNFSNGEQNIPRGTSFAQALEVARKAETHKQERKNSTTLPSQSPSLSEDDGHIETSIDAPPTIVVSSDVSPVVMPEIPIADDASVSSTALIDSFSLEEVQPKEELSDKPISEAVISNDTSTVPTATTYNPLIAREVVRVGTPPLNIRKHKPTNLSTPSVVDKTLKDPDTNDVPTEQQDLVSLHSQVVKSDDLSAEISDSHKEEAVDPLPVLQVEADGSVPGDSIEMKSSALETLPIPPDIVIFNEQPEETSQELDVVNDSSNAGVRSREIDLTLDSDSESPTQSLIGQIPHRAMTAPPELNSLPTSLTAKAITSPGPFLSPPETGSSLSSLGSRPVSMIETSPQIVTQMLRMTPAISRGIPMFVPAADGHPRKSDFVHFPPTPEDETSDGGSLTIQKSSLPGRMRSGSDPEDARSQPSRQTFSAVVHRKVRETPTSAAPNGKLQPLPQTPQPQRVKRATILEAPLSPGHGELAALLHEAVLLENTLNKGELPSEETEEETQQDDKKAKEAAATVQAKDDKAEDEERSRMALTAAQLQSKRDDPTTGRLKHTFLVPLSKVRSRHRKEVYTAKAESLLSKTQEPQSVQPESANLPSQSATNSSPIASPTLPKLSARQSIADSVSTSNSITQLPPKFSSLRNFGSISRATAGGGASTRTSHSRSSEISSEESSSAVALDEFGLGGTGSTLSFPSVSPKKTLNPLARATSFAEKLWSRGRTKSGGSTLSSTTEVKEHLADDSPVKTPASRNPATIPPPLGFLTLPRHSEVPPLSLDEPGLIIPIRRSTSSKRSAVYFSPAPELTATPQIPAVPKVQQTSPSSLLSVSNEFIRPSSANSASSAGSLPSPLFNQELVDAFPSVPATTPSTATIGYNHFPRREMSLAAPATTSFDNALLSSAIHLHKMATPKASSKPLPSDRPATPTSRPSGEIMSQQA